MASGLVQHVADQWRQGVPLRLARKILRKQGIHAWSLLVWVEGDQRANLIQQLAPPRWLIEASRDSLLWERIAGMIFRRLDSAQKPLKVPYSWGEISQSTTGLSWNVSLI